jgi:hypothetical protein
MNRSGENDDTIQTLMRELNIDMIRHDMIRHDTMRHDTNRER